MGKDKKNMNTKQKLLFILALFISNSFTYLLLFRPDQCTLEENQIITRTGYQKLKLKVSIKTPLEPGLPISITNNSYSHHIKNVFFIGYPSSQISDLNDFDSSGEVFVYLEVPQEETLAALKMKQLLLVPFDFELDKNQKRITHEINY